MTTTTIEEVDLAAGGSGVRQLSTLQIVGLHLGPGALMTAGFVGLAPVVEAAGLPPIAALLASIAIILVPIELGVMAWAARRDRLTYVELVPYRRSIGVRRWAWLVPLLVVLGFLGFGLHQVVEPALMDRLFAWLPDWYASPIHVDRIGDYSSAAWIATLIAFFALNGFVGPIVEELYFRGYLLPRMQRFGRWAPMLNVTLFSLYHFWSPWQLVARILGIGPTVYAVWWTRNIYLGMVVHCTLNVLGVVVVSAMVLGRI